LHTIFPSSSPGSNVETVLSIVRQGSGDFASGIDGVNDEGCLGPELGSDRRSVLDLVSSRS
jgi:hypothetical protein